MTGGVPVNPEIEAICKAIDTLTPSMETLDVNGFHTSSMKICLRHKIPRCGKCMPPDNRAPVVQALHARVPRMLPAWGIRRELRRRLRWLVSLMGAMSCFWGQEQHGE